MAEELVLNSEEELPWTVAASVCRILEDQLSDRDPASPDSQDLLFRVGLLNALQGIGDRLNDVQVSLNDISNELGRLGPQ